MPEVIVQTNANIPLNKYWGKRDEKLFLPTKSSFALGISELKTITKISLINEQNDQIFINWTTASAESSKKIVAFLDLFRNLYKIEAHFKIETQNHFPTGAGLASSSSGFAALALGLNEVCGLKLSSKELSILARQGSGSACRSIIGGLSLWHKGIKADGSDSYAEQIFDHNHWPELRIVIAVVKSDAKPISSRQGMQITVQTSPSYQNWVEQSEKSLKTLIPAIKAKDFKTIGELTEQDWHGMQQTMLDSSPQLNYWTEKSQAVIQTVQRLRNQNIDCFFTTDAGPNVKILCMQDDAVYIKNEIEKISSVTGIISKIAANPQIIDKT